MGLQGYDPGAVSHVRRLRITDRIFFVTVNLRRGWRITFEVCGLSTMNQEKAAGLRIRFTLASGTYSRRIFRLSPK